MDCLVGKCNKYGEEGGGGAGRVLMRKPEGQGTLGRPKLR